MQAEARKAFFSVVIPTRNRPLEFEQALISVLEQDYPEFEVVVVNDGTKAAMVADYQQLKQKYADKPITWLDLHERARGHGHCYARNHGVDQAKGNFICFLDDDDWWTDPSFLTRANQNIVNLGADFLFANQQAVDHQGNSIDNVWVEDLPQHLAADDPRQQQQTFQVTVTEMIRANGFPHQNCWAISTDLYHQIGGMDENLRYEPDRDIYMRALDKAQSLVYDRTVMALHNVPDKSQQKNASTQTSLLEKKLFQLRTAEKGILFSSKPELIAFCQYRKGVLLKQICEELAAQQRWSLAYDYAKQALAAAPNVKWLGYTGYCGFKALCGSHL